MQLPLLGSIQEKEWRGKEHGTEGRAVFTDMWPGEIEWPGRYGHVGHQFLEAICVACYCVPWGFPPALSSFNLHIYPSCRERCQESGSLLILFPRAAPVGSYFHNGITTVLYTPTACPTDSDGLLSDPAISDGLSGQSVGSPSESVGHDWIPLLVQPKSSESPLKPPKSKKWLDWPEFCVRWTSTRLLLDL